MNERLFLSPPHMGGKEIEYVIKAFESNYIAPVGPMIDLFEKKFLNITGLKYCVALSSGTAAMHLVIRHLLSRRRSGLSRSERKPVVLASSLTFIGSVTPAVFEGCEIRFIDCDMETWNMSPKLLEKALSECMDSDSDLLAVIPTDLYGQCCDLPKIVEICNKYNVPVICDSAEAMGAHYSDSKDVSERKMYHAGAGAYASIYSFNGNKIITTSGGGMLASADEELIDHARKLSTQARDSKPYYQHSEIGYNYRLSNVLAAIGCGQLEVLEQRVSERRQIFSYYESHLGKLPGIEFMPEASYGRCNRWLTCLTVDPEKLGCTNEEIRLFLEQHNIEARHVWKPMHMQPVFMDCKVIGGENCEKLFQNGLCLPSGSSMTKRQVEIVSNLILKLLEEC